MQKDIKTFLKSIEKTRRKAEAIGKQLNDLSEIHAMNYENQKGKGGAAFSSVEQLAIKREKIINKQLDEIERWIDLIEQLNIILEKIDPLTAYIISLKYVCCWTWEQIGDKLNYSARHVYRLHIKGLNDLQEVYNEAQASKK